MKTAYSLFGLLPFSVALLTASTSFAADSLSQRNIDLAKSSINQYILTASDLGSAFPSNSKLSEVDQAKITCLSAGTATVGFAMLRVAKFKDDEIKPLLAPISASVKSIEAEALKTARGCGLLF